MRILGTMIDQYRLGHDPVPAVIAMWISNVVMLPGTLPTLRSSLRPMAEPPQHR